MIEKHVKIYRSIFLGTVGTVVQLLKLRGFEGRKVAQCELETISFFGTARYSWYRVILGPSVSNHIAIVASFCTRGRDVRGNLKLTSVRRKAVIVFYASPRGLARSHMFTRLQLSRRQVSTLYFYGRICINMCSVRG